MFLSLLRWHWIQNIEQKKTKLKTKEIETWKIKTERRKPSFTNRIGRNAELYKPALNKIMTTHD